MVKSWLFQCIGLLIALAAVPAFSQGQPDLIVDQKVLRQNWLVRTESFTATQCDAIEGGISPGEHPILRFSVSTANIGDAAVVVGDPNAHVAANDGLFEYATCHHHFHFRHYAQYELVDPLTGVAWRAAKRGFCMEDNHTYQPNPNNENPTFTVCGAPGIPGNQGISPGWADLYDWQIQGQYFVLDGGDGQPPVPPGNYLIRITVNPGFIPAPGEPCRFADPLHAGVCHQLPESNFENNINQIPVVVPGPVAAHWKLDEPFGATVFADASGYQNWGFCSACPSLGGPGEVGTNASFNGSSQIMVPDSPSLRLNQFTIALWIFPTQVKSDYQLLVAKEDSSGANRNYGLYIVPNSLRVRYAVWAGDCTTKLAANSSGQMALNTWNHIVFTYDGTSEKFYLNGVLDSSNPAAAAGLCQAAVPVKIGKETSAFLPLSGALDDVQIYTQALAGAQATRLYTPLAAYWKLDEPSGATVFADASGNGEAASCSSACPSLGLPGEAGTAAGFNSGGQITVPDSPSLRLNQFTIALWVFPTQVTQMISDYQPLVAKEDSFGANRNYALYIVPNSLQVRYAVWAADCVTKLAANSSGQMAVNTWNQIVFTYDGATEKLYLNGILDSSRPAAAAGLCQAAVPLKMGMETSAFLPFRGALDEVQIFSQALTAEQVSDLFAKSLI